MCMCKGFSYKNTTQSSEVNIMFQFGHLLPGTLPLDSFG